jgi:hypothetical protein
LHHTPQLDERVRVTARRDVVVVLLVVVDCEPELLAAAVPPLVVAVVLVVVGCEPELLATAVSLLVVAADVVSAAPAAVEATVAVAACWPPNAIQPPSVPTTAAVAIADFRRAASRRRFDISFLLIAFLSTRESLQSSVASPPAQPPAIQAAGRGTYALDTSSGSMLCCDVSMEQ